MFTMKISRSVVSRAAHMTIVAQLVVKGDSGAVALLGNPPALAMDFIEFAERQAKNHKALFVDVIGSLDSEDIESLRKNLPKDSPERAKYLAAIKEVISDLPSEFELFPAGTLTIGKEQSKCAMIVTHMILDGKRQKFMLGLKKWQWIASLTESDRTTLKSLLTSAERDGLK
jgi:hypothetical protein